MRYNSNIYTIDHLIETLDFFIDKFLSGFRREVIAKYYLEKMMSLYPVITGVRYANEEEDRKATDLIVETNFPKTGPVTVPLQIKSSSAMQIKHRKGFFSRKIPSIVVPNTHAFDLLAPKLFDVIRTYVLSGQVLHLSLHRDKVKPSS